MNGSIEKVEEENYFFALYKYKGQVTDLIKKDIYQVIPDTRKNEILSFLEHANDVSFSRPKTSLPRGIPVPGDDDHVMYVRCDALSNYITGQGYAYDEKKFNEIRPADIHLIGKDILRFHAAFWPAMLLSAKLAIPKKLIVHGHITLNGQKMSKSTGNVIDPMDILEVYERDAFVFHLLYDINIANDGDFSPERLGNMYESMLIGGRGNLVNRVTSLCKKYSITSGKFNKQKWEVFKENNDSKLVRYIEE
jgi:methionyl-tRNA synthetase